MPRRGEAEAERNAMILMTYFHPYSSWWTVPEELEERVPHISQLKKNRETWQEARDAWFARGAGARETRNFMLNFLNVTAQRPSDDAANGVHEDDL